MAETITNKENFETEVLKSDKLVLVDFFAEWCPPCQAMLPIVNRVSQEHGDKLKIVKVDIDKNPEIAEEYGVMSIPTFIFFDKGNPTETIVGAMPEDEIIKRIK